MKKIKIERNNNDEGGVSEVVALNVTMPALQNRDKPDVDELPDDKSKKDIGSEDSNHERSNSYEQNDTAAEQQLKSQSQPSQQQFPNIQRSLPPGAPANYCNICNKELCNKYFMKTHMQKMHGINLDDYPREAANSGGVICDICQKELCSKYFLKVHKSNTHGITDFNNGPAGSQAANAATAVAAIALTNYSLNNAQKRAALNLALNQHQLQSRQAAALMNAAAASAAFNPLQVAQAAKAAAMQQRDHLNASSIIGHFQQHKQQQQRQQPQNLQSQPQQIDLQKQQPTQPAQLEPPQLINPNISGPNLHDTFPAALLAATTSNPLLAAQLAQQHQFNPLTLQQQIGQRSHQPTQPPCFSLNDEALDTEEDTSDRDSLADHSIEQHKNRLAMSEFHHQLQSQQALLNAAAVFNPTAAAAAMMAIQQQQQQHHQHQLEEQSLDSRQQTAMDLRNQTLNQLITQHMIGVRQQEQHQVNDCNTILNNNAQNQAAQIYESGSDPNQRQTAEEEDEEDEDFDSDRDSLVDEGIFRQSNARAALTVAATATTDSPTIDCSGDKGNTNNGSLLGSSINNENDTEGLINFAKDLKRRANIAPPTGCKAQPYKSAQAAKSQVERNNRSNNSSSPANVTPSPIRNLLNVNSSLYTPSSVVQRTQSTQNNSNCNANNSRYLRHYTEACPICERRFKSIKWLQSHVMNDHKNEIGNLFNLLVQVLLCNSNNSTTGGGIIANGSNGSTETMNASASGSSGTSALTSLSGPLRGLGSTDLQQARQQQQQQQQQSQTTSATSTSTRDV